GECHRKNDHPISRARRPLLHDSVYCGAGVSACLLHCLFMSLRSTHWFGSNDRDGFIHRSWMRGYPRDAFDGRPVIGICNTWSELTPCNAHLREIADRVRRGVLEAGGFPLEFPVMSLGETNLRPTAMLFRNLASMDVEESIRGNPIDGVVLLCGCD